MLGDDLRDLSWVIKLTDLCSFTPTATSVAKQRIVNTKFWDDSYIAGLSPTEKLLFLYLITNPLTNISGVYELPIKRAAFDVGIGVKEVETVFQRFEADGKVHRLGTWVGITNFIKHQSLNPKIRTGIAGELKRAPKELVDRLSIDYQNLCIAYDSLSHLNSNSNTNSNSNALPVWELSTARREEINNRTKAIGEKWRVKG
jgi:hypothetical protein